MTTAAVLLVALVCVALLLPVPYVTMRPGPTRDVLAMAQGEPVISIEGRRTYPTDGALRLTTVSVTSPEDSIGIGEAVQAWLSPDDAVVPREAIYPESTSAEESEAQSAAAMAGSQEVAAAAALRLLGEEVPEYAEVVEVSPGTPAEGRLRAGDVIVAIDGEQMASAEETVRAIRDRAIGDDVQISVRRDGSVRQLKLSTVASETPDPRTSEVYPVVGIGVRATYDLPVDVHIRLPGAIGGPSAGAIFALGVYDELTPGSLTGGLAVAGTGEITAEGTIGPIGGIQQKIAGAAEEGAEVFLVPADNCAEALAADVEGEDIELVRVADLRSAVDSLEALAEDPGADVPGCG